MMTMTGRRTTPMTSTGKPSVPQARPLGSQSLTCNQKPLRSEWLAVGSDRAASRRA